MVALGLGQQSATGADAQRRAQSQAFMKMKLAFASGALEGLTLEKFDLVSKNAVRMRDMTMSNQWWIMKQPDYLRSTTNFQNSAAALYMAAVDKNLEASTEAYVGVMRSCVECHRLVRVEQKKNAAQAPKAKVESVPIAP